MNRIQLINYLIQRYHFSSYLEIGCYTNECFDQISCPKKVGVDPVSGGTHRMTSDEFFAQNAETFDIIFIDGLHWSEQVLRDINHSLKSISQNGIIVLHDCNPPDEINARYPDSGQTSAWNGDVWKAIVLYRQISSLDIVVGDFDWGCGLIRKLPNTALLYSDTWYSHLTYHDLERNRQRYLRLMSFEDIINWLNQGDEIQNRLISVMNIINIINV